ncbi:hypothetical protein [Streptomyces sp. NPDC048157]|uniref:hypothetical protein n=1 Tax=Streptomyces sp. NPDC048157 TaxID=3365503 RepID=UPI00371AB0EB
MNYVFADSRTNSEDFGIEPAPFAWATRWFYTSSSSPRSTSSRQITSASSGSLSRNAWRVRGLAALQAMTPSQEP